MAIFHEPNTFGEFLQRQLNSELRPKTRSKELVLFNFEVTEQLEFADLMPQLWCEKLDMIVYLGFAPRAMDLLNKLRWYRADADQVTCPSKDISRSFNTLTMLLSSGAPATRRKSVSFSQCFSESPPAKPEASIVNRSKR